MDYKINKGKKDSKTCSFKEVKSMMQGNEKEPRKAMKEDGKNPYSKKTKGNAKMGMHKPNVVIAIKSK